MIGRTHLTTGVTAGAWTGAVASTFAPDLVAILLVPVVAYAALLPDLDHRSSTATYSLGPITMLVSWILRRFVEHRGGTHDVRYGPAGFGVPAGLAALALPAPLAAWWWTFGVAVALGVLAHVWGDARTLGGVPWFGGRLRIGRVFRTGSRHERRLLEGTYQPVAYASLLLGAGVLVYPPAVGLVPFVAVVALGVAGRPVVTT